MNIYDVVGVTGALLLVTAYFLLTTKHFNSHARGFQLMNLGAAVMLIIYNLHKDAHVGLLINAFWGGIAVVGLLWHKKHRRLHKAAEGRARKISSKQNS